MENVTFIKVEQSDGTLLDFAIIDKGKGQFTSMLKSDFDKPQVEHLTEIISSETPAE